MAIAATVVASFGGVTVSVWVDVSDRSFTAGSVLSAAVVLAFTTVGAVVAAARPANRVGWLMLVGGAFWALGDAGVAAATRGIVAAPGTIRGVSVWALTGSALRAVAWYLVTVGVGLVFPDGRIASGHSRRLVRLLAVTMVVSVVAVLTAADANVTGLGSWRNPIALPESLQPVSGFLSIAAVLLGIVVTVQVVVELARRWRRGTAIQRQRLAMFGIAAALPIAVAPVVLAGATGGWLFSAAALPLPLTIGFAVLARGLYDLKTSANRTVVWGTLSLIVAAVYALVIGGLEGLLGAGRLVWLPWLAAAVIAVLFAPLRDMLQRGVNRVMFGRWDQPYDVLSALGQRLEQSTDIQRLLVDVVAELGGLGLRQVSIRDASGRVVAGEAIAAPDLTVLRLSAYGNSVGTLAYRPAATPLRDRDRQLLEDLGGHLGGVLHVLQLTDDVQLARERLVLSREEERRRLRRDLHDGVGPALAAHLLRLDAIAGTVEHHTDASIQVEHLRGELKATVLEVRRVVEGLRPPALDELGLAGALTSATARLSAGAALSVDVQIAPLPELPAAMEVATFRIATEAVTNALRHSQASTCQVEIGVTDGVLRVCIRDDGRGITPAATTSGGHGLQTMRERAEELRGRLYVVSEDGTMVIAEFPLPPANATAGRGLVGSPA